jgi:glutathione S-transferase
MSVTKLDIPLLFYSFSISQAEEVEAYKANYLPLQLSALEKLLTSNGDGHGYFVGKKLTVADVCIFDVSL